MRDVEYVALITGVEPVSVTMIDDLDAFQRPGKRERTESLVFLGV